MTYEHFFKDIGCRTICVLGRLALLTGGWTSLLAKKLKLEHGIPSRLLSGIFTFDNFSPFHHENSLAEALTFVTIRHCMPKPASAATRIPQLKSHYQVPRSKGS